MARHIFNERKSHSSVSVTLLSFHEVALAEQALCAMGKRRHLQEKLDAEKDTKPPRRPKPVRQRRSFGGGDRKKVGSPALDKPTKPLRHSLDNVGDHEVKVHPLSEMKVYTLSDLEVHILNDLKVHTLLISDFKVYRIH